MSAAHENTITLRQALGAVALGSASLLAGCASTPRPAASHASTLGDETMTASNALSANHTIVPLPFAPASPCYLFTVIPAPYFRRIAKNASIRAFVDGVTAAASGAIAGATIVLGRRAVIDLPTVLVALVALALLVKFKKTQEPALIVAAGVVGIILTSVRL